MKTILMISCLCLLGLKVVAAPCKSSENEKMICHLDSQLNGEKLSAQVYSRDCEFPEGQLRRCIKFRVCNGDQKIEEGIGVLPEDADLNLYCRQKKEIDLMMSKKNVQAYIECSKSKKSTQKINLKNNGLSMLCNWAKSKGRK